MPQGEQFTVGPSGSALEVAVNNTPLVGGTSNRVLYDGGGVIQESSKLGFSSSQGQLAVNTTGFLGAVVVRQSSVASPIVSLVDPSSTLIQQFTSSGYFMSTGRLGIPSTAPIGLISLQATAASTYPLMSFSLDGTVPNTTRAAIVIERGGDNSRPMLSIDINGAQAIWCDSGANLNFGDVRNIIFTSSATGSKIGTSTNQLIGFYNATPVVQQAGYTALAAGGNTGANSGTIGTFSSGIATIATSVLNDALISILNRVNSVETALKNLGLTS